jgi:mono/diheme cytochrome c family protein
MRRGEKVILLIIATCIVAVVGIKAWLGQLGVQDDPGIPFYSTASAEISRAASAIYQEQNCKKCHTLWTTRDMTLSVPAPALDGIGSLRDEAWLYDYLSAPVPQDVLPSRLKKEYQMPSFAQMPEADRRTLARYLASLKVKDWYLEEARKAEYEKLTGKTYAPAVQSVP